MIYVYCPSELAFEQINTKEEPTYLHHDQAGATAQFMSADPPSKSTGAPYTYAGDNPLTYDPTGVWLLRVGSTWA